MTALEMLASQPTVNIEGLVGGYTGPGGKTILPHQAIVKLDLRLVPDMTAAGALESLRAHLTKHGFGDIEVRMKGGYDPTSTSAEAGIIRAAISVYRRAGVDPVVLEEQQQPGLLLLSFRIHRCPPLLGINGSPANFSNKVFPSRSLNRHFSWHHSDGLTRRPDLPPLSPIRSLAYFQPVISELLQQPLPTGYVDYLRLKLRKIADAQPAAVQKTTFSEDR
jgi:hypothetical protein